MTGEMKALIEHARLASAECAARPYSVVASIREQYILNTPVIKPLLIFVLSGVKHLGRDGEIVCPSGTFLFLSNAPNIHMRNVPEGEYFALLIEFEYSDFDPFRNRSPSQRRDHFQGTMDDSLRQALHQFIDLPRFVPPELWPLRRQELLGLLYLSGYQDVGAIIEHPSTAHRLHDIITQDIQCDWTLAHLADKLALSEPTLRRRLKAEGISIKTILSRARLGYGLHLVQTTLEPIGRIAERCGYPSQSRFTDKFKSLFGITPTELRKTRLPD